MVQKWAKKFANVGATTVHRSISAVTRCHPHLIKKRHMINCHDKHLEIEEQVYSHLKKKIRHTLPNLNRTSREMTGWEGGREGREGAREGGRLSWAAVGAVLCCVVL